jgi:hypothetical protein
MRTLLTSTAAIAALLTGTVGAGDIQPPFTKEGLWEATSSHTMMGKTTKVTVKVCQNHESEQKERDSAAQLRQKNQCTYTTTQPTPGTYVTESKCTTGPRAGNSSKSTITFQGDTAYHVEMRMTSSSGMESTMVADSKYVGSCPATMKPGDTVMGDGQKIGN